MHHKLISSRLINKGYKRDGLKVKTQNAMGYPSDSSTESNMTSVAMDHVPLSSGLSHVVRMELGAVPAMLSEPSNIARTQSAYASFLHSMNGPIEQAFNNVVLRQEVLEQQRRRIVQQLQLTMQKQTEYGPYAAYPNATPNLSSVASMQKHPAQPMGRTITGNACGALRAATNMGILDERKDHPTMKTMEPSHAKASPATEVKKRRSFLGRKSPLGTDKEEAAQDGPAKKSKRPRSASKDSPSSDNGDGSDEDLRFRRYQNEQWTEKFSELLAFKNDNGHCQVPHTYPPNPQLARWVKRQRYQFKLKSDKKPSTMTDERVELLQEAGFVWDSHAAAWLEKYSELKKFAFKQGHCNLTSTNQKYPQLATWVKCQRRQYKLLKEGKVSNMTDDRAALLEEVGFVWGLRK